MNEIGPPSMDHGMKPRNTQEYTETIPQHSRPRKPIVQDIYTEDHYCIARSSGNWTSDVGVQDVDGDTMKTPAHHLAVELSPLYSDPRPIRSVES